MSYTLLSEFIQHLDIKNDMKLGHAPDEVQQRLEDIGLPLDILRFLQWSWPQRDTQIAHISILSSPHLINDELSENLLKQTFLQLGSAPNGDFFVLDFSSTQCRPGFITHEEYWEYENELRKIFIPIARSMESLFYRIVEGKYIPTDYYAAEEFNAFLRKEENSTQHE